MNIQEIIAKLEEMAEHREEHILPGCIGWDEIEPLREAAALLKTHPEARPNEPQKEAGPFNSAEEAFDALDWGYTYSENGEIELEKYSPAGEDFIFTITGEDIQQEVRDYADDFDIDEHVELWIGGRGERGVPQTARELVEDAEAIKAMLEELADALEKVTTNCDQGTYDCETCIIRNGCDRRADAE